MGTGRQDPAALPGPLGTACWALFSWLLLGFPPSRSSACKVPSRAEEIERRAFALEKLMKRPPFRSSKLLRLLVLALLGARRLGGSGPVLILGVRRAHDPDTGSPVLGAALAARACRRRGGPPLLWSVSRANLAPEAGASRGSPRAARRRPAKDEIVLVSDTGSHPCATSALMDFYSSRKVELPEDGSPREA